MSANVSAGTQETNISGKPPKSIDAKKEKLQKENSVRFALTSTGVEKCTSCYGTSDAASGIASCAKDEKGMKNHGIKCREEEIP